VLAHPPAKMLVINEWLFHDATGENGQSAQRETEHFLRQLAQSEDKFAVLWGSPWIEKSYDLMTHNDIGVESLSILIQSLIWTLDKCLVLQPEFIEATEIPQNAIAAAPEEDIYLIQTYFAANADLLITTDEGLYDAFEARQDVEVIYRDTFLNDYLNS